ncbi:transcriptional regulator [Acrocarpospora pleiomorpha]|uniref:Transcriptional regulator n=1 Tax=Acrocarpospora pleiomorpha TaxID=90975 RepID=A0A5M3XXC2_9ACTN|nr:helix-turn-helix transcriptional regulator [Acrocarpospora pleiomorpha]GES25642.1 transcriptional regulator [Acrocarpospora pleiomorpha]
MAEVDAPNPRRRRLAQELRRLREATDLNGEDAAKRVGWSAAKLSRIETAKTLPTESDVTTLLNLYEVGDGVFGNVQKLRLTAAQKGWWEKESAALDQGYVAYIGFEAEATVMRNWEPHVVPGLLQTEEYARALLGHLVQPINQIPPIWSHSRVEARMRRQRTHLFAPEPLTLQVIIDEPVLHRPVGDGAIMRNQLQYLDDIATRDNVEIRITPEATQVPMTTGPFVHFTFRDFPDIVYLEDLTGGRFIEGVEAVFSYERAFEHLAKGARDESDSRRLIQEAIVQWQT